MREILMKSFYFVMLSLIVTALAAFTNLSDKLLIITQIVFIVFFLFRCNVEESTRIIIFLFVVNGLQRRVMNGDQIYFKANDILILVPYFAIFFLIIRHKISVPVKFKLLLFILIMHSTVFLSTNLASIGWGTLNFIFVLFLGLHFANTFSEKLLNYFMNLGVLSSIYIFWQKVSMPEYDRGWCNQRRTFFYILESCDSSSTRLWGTMESAINMSFFLSICIILLLSKKVKGFQIISSVIKFSILSVALFLTGTRTFLFLIPISFFIGLILNRTYYGVKFLKGVFATGLIFLALPTLAATFSYDERWTSRLNLTKIFQDVSLQARIQLVTNFFDSLDFRTFMFGEGIGTHSRGINAIDNGYLALILELGFPIAFFICILIFSHFIGRMKINRENDLSILSVAILGLLANFSFSVISGSSSVFLWMFCLAIKERMGDSERENSNLQ